MPPPANRWDRIQYVLWLSVCLCVRPGEDSLRPACRLLLVCRVSVCLFALYFVVYARLIIMWKRSTMNLTAGIQAWYDEKADYHLDTQTCADGAVCGHYTQVPLSATCVTRSVVARRRPGSIFWYPTQHFWPNPAQPTEIITWRNPPHRWATLYHGCARSSASGRSHMRVLPPRTLCPTTSAPWLILSSSENCLNHTILVKLLTFVDFCVFLGVSAFGWLL